MQKKAIVIHSGGMDSSLCLALALKEFGPAQTVSLSFSYQQRHEVELNQAKKICRDWGVDHAVISIESLKKVTASALMNRTIEIEKQEGLPPNTMVIGRNGLMAHLAGMYAYDLGAECLYMGVMELEGANSGYRDCSRKYMDLHETLLRIDLDRPLFHIRTPLIRMTKKETMELAHELGLLSYLLEETITCYEGIPFWGCKRCPACFLRNQGIKEFTDENPHFKLPLPYLSRGF